MDYDARDMRVGIHLAKLLVLLPIVAALLAVDPRGAYFRQSCIEGVVRAVFAKPAYAAAAMTAASSKLPPMNLNDYISDQAYTVRVLCGHFRERYKLWDAGGRTTNKSTF